MESAQKHFNLKNRQIYFETKELRDLKGYTSRVTEGIWEQAVAEISKLDVVVGKGGPPVPDDRGLLAVARDPLPPVLHQSNHHLAAGVNVKQEALPALPLIIDISSDEDKVDGICVQRREVKRKRPRAKSTPSVATTSESEEEEDDNDDSDGSPVHKKGLRRMTTRSQHALAEKAKEAASSSRNKPSRVSLPKIPLPGGNLLWSGLLIFSWG